MTPCCLVAEYQRFGGTYYLFGRRRQHFPPEFLKCVPDYTALEHKRQHGTDIKIPSLCKPIIVVLQVLRHEQKEQLRDVAAWENTTEIPPKEIKCGLKSFSSAKDYRRGLLNTVMYFKF
jgi:hypothetical protein